MFVLLLSKMRIAIFLPNLFFKYDFEKVIIMFCLLKKSKKSETLYNKILYNPLFYSSYPYFPTVKKYG